MKYEYAYELECDCINNTIMTLGVQDTENKCKKTEFGNCIICDKKYKAKKVKKTKIENGQIVPTPITEVFE